MELRKLGHTSQNCQKLVQVMREKPTSKMKNENGEERLCCLWLSLICFLSKRLRSLNWFMGSAHKVVEKCNVESASTFLEWALE